MYFLYLLPFKEWLQSSWKSLMMAGCQGTSLEHYDTVTSHLLWDQSGWGEGRRLELSLGAKQSENSSNGNGLSSNCLVLSFLMRYVGWETQRIYQVNYSSLLCWGKMNQVGYGPWQKIYWGLLDSSTSWTAFGLWKVVPQTRGRWKSSVWLLLLACWLELMETLHVVILILSEWSLSDADSENVHTWGEVNGLMMLCGPLLWEWLRCRRWLQKRRRVRWVFIGMLLDSLKMIY